MGLTDFQSNYKQCIEMGHDWNILDADSVQCSLCKCQKMRKDRIPFGLSLRAQQYYKEKYHLN